MLWKWYILHGVVETPFQSANGYMINSDPFDVSIACDSTVGWIDKCLAIPSTHFWPSSHNCETKMIWNSSNKYLEILGTMFLKACTYFWLVMSKPWIPLRFNLDTLFEYIQRQSMIFVVRKTNKIFKAMWQIESKISESAWLSQMWYPPLLCCDM